MSRRSAEGGTLKGVATSRNGQTYAVNIPKFSPPANANSINITPQDVHERFKKLTPKQRIAVLTIRDRNIASRLYVLTNALWYKKMSDIRGSVGVKDDDEIAIRTFVNGFEFIFGESLDDDDDEDEDGEPVTRSKSAGVTKTVSSSISGVTANRGINSTFSYTESDPTLFRPKLNFISTRDVMKLIIDNSKDFLASRIRYRCRVLQNPEMWVRIMDSFKDDHESITMPEYESIIIQLLEFRLVYEFLNGGSMGEPFANIKKQYPTDEEKWAKKDNQLSNMEEGTVTAAPVVAPTKKTSKKKRMLEKLASNPHLLMPTPTADTSSDKSDNDADELLVEHHRRQKRLSSIDITPVTQQPPKVVEIPMPDQDLMDDEWVHVGTGATKSRKASFSKPIAAPVVQRQEKRALPTLSEKAKKQNFKDLWRNSGSKSMYVSHSLSMKTTISKTFIDVVPLTKMTVRIQECPF